jgi:tRNA(Ile)-lysidine synthase
VNHEFEQQLAAAWPTDRWQDVTVLVAVSGGPDSVALVRSLAALAPRGAGRLVIAHFNHALRGPESDADERFVAELAASLAIPIRVGRPLTSTSPVLSDAPQSDPASTCPPLNDCAEPAPQHASEESSRDARYAFLIATAKEIGARYVVTAHTADDQAETVLHRIVRGTGLAGLSGMRRARELAPGIAIVRPLLFVRRAEVLAYLADIGQAFRVDSSNLVQDYTRNRLRHDLLPKLAAEYNPRIVAALLRLADLAGEAQRIVEVEAAALAARCIVTAEQADVATARPARVMIDTTPLTQANAYLVREMLVTVWQSQEWPLQAMGYDEWESLASLASDQSAPTGPRKRLFPGEVTAERTTDRLTLTRPARAWPAIGSGQ